MGTLTDAPASFEILNFLVKDVKGYNAAAVTHGTSSLCRIGFALRFGPHFLLKTPMLFRTFLDLSGFGFLRQACGTAVKSVCISISVSLPVRVRDEPVECLPWTCRTGVCRYLPCLEMYVSGADSRWLMPHELRCLSHFWNSKLAHAVT